MSMPSPYELGAAIGGNVSGAISGAQENTQLDQILQQAMQSNDPRVQNDVMRQILTRVSPEKRPMALQALQQHSQQLQQRRQNAAYEEQGLNPNLPESINKEIVKGKNNPKKNEGVEAAKNSLNLLNRQREILATGHLGPKFGIGGTGRKAGSTISSEGRALRSEYARLGKALVQASAPLKITNRAEFMHYAEGLEDPNLTREELKGNLDAMERIIKNSIGEEQPAQNNAQATVQSPPQAERPPLTSFIR